MQAVLGGGDRMSSAREAEGIRLKLEADPQDPRWIHNVRGVGYRMEAPA